ncbi:hypothetical protein BH11PSE3_BH11PSE3_31780 [soil metagenome]
MSGLLPAEYDLSFLARKTLEQVCIGRYQTVLNFFENATIEIACGLVIVVGGRNRKIIDKYGIDVGIELANLLGKVVCHAEKQDRAVILRFEDVTGIRLLLKGDGHEAVNVSGGPSGTLTFH